MKRIAEFVILAAAAAVILVVFSGFQGVQAKTSLPQTNPPQTQGDSNVQRTISVSGTGRVQATPDQATIVIGVETKSDTASAAMSDNNTSMQALISALTASGISRQNIQTQNLQLYPRYQQNQPANQQAAPQIIGYTAVNTVQVTVTNLDNIGETIDAAVQAGGNRIQGINFDLSDPVAALDQARTEAMRDAQHKAEQLVSLTDSSLGMVLSISEFSSTPPPMVRSSLQMDAAAAVPVEPGSQTIEVNVQVTWLLENASGGGSPTSQGTPPSLNQNAAVNIDPQNGPPGTNVNVSATGFPPNTTVNIGLGVWQSEYQVVDTVRTDRNGQVQVDVQIPDTASASERWAVVVALADNPSARVVSSAFNVT